jgi:biopolymer transport protein ExbD
MAIQMGKTGQSEVSDINMTPMIDVLLVLIVIFMIATPMLQKSIDVQLPLDKPSTNQAEQSHIVLEMKSDGSYAVNTAPVTIDGLHQRLTEIYTGRPDKILFIKAEPDVIYQDVITAMDIARGAGVVVLGAMLPPKVQQGS